MLSISVRAGVPAFVQGEWLERYGVLAAFSTRLGGVSRGRYSSLNLGMHVGDEPDSVRENRRRLSAFVAADLGSFVVGEQVHGSHIEVVSLADSGRGALDQGTALPLTDGLVTAEPGLALMVMVADCVPIILLSEEPRVVAVVHAGWRGTAARIAVRAVDEMKGRFGSDPLAMRALIGPSIGPCCYRVGPEVALKLQRVSSHVVDPGGVDLGELNAEQLIGAGLASERVERLRLCTSCRTDLFYSHRAEAQHTGRMAGVVIMGRSRG